MLTHFQIPKLIHFQILLILLLAACMQKEKDTPPPNLLSHGFTVPLDTINGYTKNVITGDSIIFIDKHLDTLITGRKIPAIGKTIDMTKVAKPKTVPVGTPKKDSTNTNVHLLPSPLGEGPGVRSIKAGSPRIIPLGSDTFLMPKAIAITGRKVPVIQPKPVTALPPQFRDDANCNIQYLDVDQGMASSYIYSMLEDQSGNLWFGTEGGGVSRYDGKTFTHYTTKEGLSNNIVWSMLEDKSGNLWFGTYGGGVSRYDGDSSLRSEQAFTHYTTKEGLSNNIVLSMLEDTSGNLYITTEKGVNIFVFEKRHPRKSGDLLRNMHTSGDSRFHGNDGDDWNDERVHTSGGSSRVLGGNDEMKIGDDEVKILTFGKQDGLIGLDGVPNSIMIDSKNRLWFGTGKALTMLDLNKYKLPADTPRVQLNSLELEQTFIDYRLLQDSIALGKELFTGAEMNKSLRGMRFTGVAPFYNYPQNLELPYYLNHLTFHYSAIEWGAPHKIRYRYTLEGLGKGWGPVVEENKAVFGNLAYGEYTFKVMAVGESLLWSEPLEYRFIIQPPWWETWWFYAMQVGVIAGCFLIAFAISRRRKKSGSIKTATTALFLATLAIIIPFEYVQENIENAFENLLGNIVFVKVGISMLFAGILLPVQRGISKLLKIRQMMIAKEQREEFEETFKEGLEQGKMIGKEEWVKEGMEKKGDEVRERMKKNGLSDSDIIKYLE